MAFKRSSGTFGPAYEAELDEKRLGAQMKKIRDVMLSAGELGIWHTLEEIGRLTWYPQASISAQLRHLRKKRFGGYIVEKRRRGDARQGVFEYQVRRPAGVQLSLIA